MTRITVLRTIGVLFALGVSALPAQSATLRTFVSGLGTDTGTCGRTAPCRTFAYALGQTSPGGEIDVLDAGDYGPVTITKAVSIVQDGAGEAGVQGTIAINAGSSDAISLRGLTIDGGGKFFDGIVFNTGGSLAVVNCVVSGYSEGIDVVPTTFSQAIGAVIHGAIDHVASNNNSAHGILINSPGGSTSISNSVLDSNAGIGLGIGASGPSTVTIRNIVASNNDIGLLNNGSETGYLAHSVVSLNRSYGLYISSPAVVFTYGDNDINGNGTDVLGTLTPVSQK